MKRICLLIICCIFAIKAAAQITLHHNYEHSGTYISLKYSGDKFFLMDIAANQCRIYNTDNSLWKTIHLDIPANNYLYDIRYVSEGLFDTETTVALAYVFFSYNSSSQVYTYTTRIITETGQELLSIPGCSFLSVHDLGEKGMKLLAYIYDYNEVPVSVQTRIFNLPDQPHEPTTVLPLTGKTQMKAFPNPARDNTVINYSLPAGVAEGEILLYDIRGILIRSFRVDNNFDHIKIDITSFPSGTYIYYLVASGQKKEGKLVIY
jgi:hypothetical protein